MYSARRVLFLIVLIIPALPAIPVNAEVPANPWFERAWNRTDLPVADGRVSRTWMWGPRGISGDLLEPYAEVGQRAVQYFDKSRMEVSDPAGDPDSPWFVTNGLLVVELVTGSMQIGDAEFDERLPAGVQVAGDAGQNQPLTYADLASFLDQPPHAENAIITSAWQPGPNEAWSIVHDQQPYASYEISATRFAVETGHRIAAPFWEFMNSSGLVYLDDSLVDDRLFEDPFFATGLPITEANWLAVPVGGVERDVLLQCFERRCLTYTPDNAPEWRVESGNVGQHYFAWRYAESPDVVLAGDRILEINITDRADNDYQATLDMAKAAGSQSVSLSIDWSHFETSPGIYLPADAPDNWLSIANAYFPGQEMKVSLFIRPVVTLARAVPADLENTAWDDPQMIARFKAFLDYAVALIPDLDLNVISIGSEHDVRFGLDAAVWADYTAFFAAAKDHLETHPEVQARWPGLDIGSELTYPGIAGPSAELAAGLNAHADAILVSYYPVSRVVEDGVRIVHGDLQTLSELAGEKPIYFMQAGFPSGYFPGGGYDSPVAVPTLGVSSDLQAEFIREIFQVWDEHAAQVRLLNITWMHDLSPESAFSIANEDPAFAVPGDPGHLEYLWTLGLRTYTGEAKPAWHTLVEEAALRGW